MTHYHLVESYSITYLTSGRDLLRLQTSVNSTQQPIVFANPDFDLILNEPGNQISRVTTQRTAALAHAKFSGLYTLRIWQRETSGRLENEQSYHPRSRPTL